MESDCSFEDFQDSKKFPAVRRSNLRKKVLTRKKVTEIAKSERSLSKTTKRFNSSQQLSLVEHGMPVLETSKSISDTLQTKVDGSCPINQITTSTSHSVISNHNDNYVVSHPHQHFSEDSNDLNEDVDAIPHHHRDNHLLHDSPAKDVSETSNHGDDDSLCHTNPEIESQRNSIIWSNENLSNQQLTPHSHSHVASQLSDDSVRDSPSKNTSTIWQCPMCKESIASYWRDSHFMHCLKRFEHKNGSGVHKPCLESFVCDICKLDITTFSALARSEHVNRCLDCQIENVKPKNVPSNDAVSENSETFISECPLCNKKSSSTQAKLAHIKKCSQAMRIDVQSVITALQLQKKHAVERISLGLPLVPIKSSVPKTKAATVRKLMREPKSAADADVQLAKALSLSIEEEEKRKDLQELSACEDMELSDNSVNPFQQIQLQPPKNDQKRKRKPSKKSVPLLVLRTEEDRLRILQEKVSSIIIAPELPEEPLCKEGVGKSPSSMEVDISIVNHERSCPLWNLSAKAEEKMSYYTPDLLEFIAPCAIEPGSKLKSLSQIPGHRIYTQQPYDFTFNSTPQNLKEEHTEVSTISPPPSTQEMLDIIVEDPISTDNEAFSHSLILEDVNTNSEKMKDRDGFLRVKNESKMFLFHDPVVSCLETLVNNTWMSDTQITVSGGSLIPAHKLLLMLRCPGLRKDLAQDGNAFLHWNNVSSEVCTNFLNFVYTGSLSWPDVLTPKILSLAKRCGMKEFEELKKAFCTDGPFIEDVASQSAVLSVEENSQDRNLSNRNPSFFTDDITRSEKDCSSPHDVNFPADLCTGTGLVNSIPMFIHQQNAASHELSAIIGIREQDTGLEGCTSFNSPAKETPKSDGILAKYSDKAAELAEIKCLEGPHLSKTKLLLGNGQTDERANSPELFICDSDDDEIPANQEVVLGKSSSTDKSISNHAILFPGFSHSSPNELISCKYNGIAPNVSSKNSCSSEFSKYCLSYSQESEQNNATAPPLHPKADTSDCYHDNEVICISENKGGLNCLSPVKEHLDDNIMTNKDSFQGNDKTVFKCSTENIDCPYNSPMKCSSQNVYSAASISKLQSGNDSVPQFYAGLYEFSPPREPLSPNFFVASESPYNSHSALLNTPVSSRRKSSKIRSTLLERENCNVLFALNNSNSPNKMHSASELLSGNCFNSNATLKRNFSDSELRHRLPNLDFDVAFFKEDVPPQIKFPPTFQSPSFERFANHHTSLHHTNLEVNSISSHAVNLTMNKQTNTTGCKSPICLSSDDDDDLVINPQGQKSQDNDKYGINSQHYKTCDEPEMNPTIQRSCESPEIISSDDDDVLPEYYTCPVSNQARNSSTASPYKCNSFISASQPLKRTYDIDLDEEIPPLRVRIQRYQDEMKKKEMELPKPASLSITNESDDSSGLPSISFSAPVDESGRDELASHRGNYENGNAQSKACTPDVHKQIKHLKNAECLISDSPITPLPNYQTMITPEIKAALKKFGIRNMPRKKAVALLSHIYDETHPIVDLSGEVINEPGTPHHQRIASSQPCRAKLHTKKRKFASQIAQDQTQNKPSKNPLAKKMKISKKSIKSAELKNPPVATQEEMDINGVSQENSDLACSQNSSKSDLSDMPEESYVESDEIVESQKYVNKELVAKKINDYIKSNTELHSKILMYEPLVLPTFQQELKDDGIRISATNLMNFLDEKCITFSVPRTEKFKKKQQQRTQKFRKRMIQKEKEQCSQACA